MIVSNLGGIAALDGCTSTAAIVRQYSRNVVALYVRVMRSCIPCYRLHVVSRGCMLGLESAVVEARDFSFIPSLVSSSYLQCFFVLFSLLLCSHLSLQSLLLDFVFCVLYLQPISGCGLVRCSACELHSLTCYVALHLVQRVRLSFCVSVYLWLLPNHVQYLCTLPVCLFSVPHIYCGTDNQSCVHISCLYHGFVL